MESRKIRAKGVASLRRVNPTFFVRPGIAAKLGETQAHAGKGFRATCAFKRRQ